MLAIVFLYNEQLQIKSKLVYILFLAGVFVAMKLQEQVKIAKNTGVPNDTIIELSTIQVKKSPGAALSSLNRHFHNKESMTLQNGIVNTWVYVEFYVITTAV